MAKKKPKLVRKAKRANATTYRNEAIKDQLAGIVAVADDAAPTTQETARRDEETVPPEAQPSEEDLFAAAVADIDASGAILAKYDVVTSKEPGPRRASAKQLPRGDPEDAADDADFDPTDSRLFLDAVDGVTAANHKKAKS